MKNLQQSQSSKAIALGSLSKGSNLAVVQCGACDGLSDCVALHMSDRETVIDAMVLQSKSLAKRPVTSEI